MFYEDLNGECRGFEYFLTTWAFVETFLLAGLKAGWGSLVFVLKEEGFYQHLCINMSNHQRGNFNKLDTSSDGNESSHIQGFLSLGDCPDQDAMFELVVTISSVLSVPINLLLGQVSFKYGIRNTRIISITMLMIGSISFVAMSQGAPWLIFIGYIGIANGGNWILQTNFQISYLFPKGGSTVTGLISGAFDASGAVLLGIKFAYEDGISLRTAFVALFCSVFLLFISTFIFLPKDFIVPREIKNNLDFSRSIDEDEPYVSENSRLIKTNETSVIKKSMRFMNISDVKSCSEEILQMNSINRDISPETKLRSISEVEPTDPENNQVALQGEGKSRNSELYGYIFSVQFMMHLTCGWINQLVLFLFIGSVNAWLGHITHNSQDEVSSLTNFLFYVMLTAPLFSLLAGYAVDFFFSIQSDARCPATRTHYALAGPCALISVTGTLLCVSIAIDTPEVTYIVAVLAVIYRAFVFSFWGSYLRYMYPTEYFGALTGIVLLVGGVLMFMQMPLFLWCQSSASGYSQVYGTLGFCTFLTLIQPLYLVYSGRKQETEPWTVTNR